MLLLCVLPVQYFRHFSTARKRLGIESGYSQDRVRIGSGYSQGTVTNTVTLRYRQEDTVRPASCSGSSESRQCWNWTEAAVTAVIQVCVKSRFFESDRKKYFAPHSGKVRLFHWFVVTKISATILGMSQN